jgi:hypothetical protein
MLALTKSTLTSGIAAFGAGVIALGLVTVAPKAEAPTAAAFTAVHLGSVELIAYLSTGTVADPPTSGTPASPPTSPDLKAAATGTFIDDVIHEFHRVTWPVGYAVVELGSFLESIAYPALSFIFFLRYFGGGQSPLIDAIETLAGGWVTFVRGIYDPISAFLGFARGINYEIPAPCTNCSWKVDWDGTVTILSGAATTATPAATRFAARGPAASVKNPATTLADAGDEPGPQPPQSARGAARQARTELSSGRSTAARLRYREQAVTTGTAHAHAIASTNRRRPATAQPNSVGNPSTESTASAQNTADR